MEGRQAIKNRSRSPPSLCVWKCGDTSGDFSASRDHHAHAHTTHVFAAFDAPALLFHLPTSQPAGEILRLSRLVKKIAPFPVILGLSTGLLVIKPCSKVSMSRLTQVKLSQVMTQDIFSYSFTIKWVNKSWVFLSQLKSSYVYLTQIKNKNLTQPYLLVVVMRTLTSSPPLILRRTPVALLSPVFASVSLLEGKMNNYLSCVVQGDQVQRLPSYYKRFNTGTGEILPCVCCYQLPFRLTLLVITR